ncbi:MAG: hsp90 co-chaperone Cdc37 [Peltula sp. TS41687]|nr:MAG: hsp90 co-chaperone Cdc37 [Peltula sp. TS41687]
MTLNYSKWDNLEVSDDSDIEVHPNVDKRSFIRAKQHQIHQERQHRRHQIQTLKYERTINDGLLTRINKLLDALEGFRRSSHETTATTPTASKDKDADAADVEAQVFQHVLDSMGVAPEDDQPPPRPEGVHAREPAEQPTYSQMMMQLLDQVKKEVDEGAKTETTTTTTTDDRADGYARALKGHRDKVTGLQKELETKLAELEKEEARKITSESYHTGFDSSFVSKSDTKKTTTTTGAEKSTSDTTTESSIELLNPGAVKKDNNTAGEQQKGVEDDDSSIDPEHIEPTKLGKEFAKIKMGDYRACVQYIFEHPAVVAECETDGLLITAFNSQLDGKDDYARQCVHQALLLQYCRSLGKDGVGLFFKRYDVTPLPGQSLLRYFPFGMVVVTLPSRITTKGHQAQKVFHDDVNSTYARIRERAKAVLDQRAADELAGGVEQIQLHAVEPGTTINIVIPRPNSEDKAERMARGVFEGFEPEMQRALESGSLDEVNKVLAKMSVEEAEKVAAQLGEGGILSIEGQVIDATTEEGQQKLKELEEQAQKAREDEEDGDEEEEEEGEEEDEGSIGDPE